MEKIIKYCNELKVINGKINEIKRVQTGKRNECYIINTNNRKIFCKVFNKNLRFASQFNKTRYYIENKTLDFLRQKGCAVPKVIYSDKKNETLFLEFISGKNLKNYIKDVDKKAEKVIIQKVIDQLIKIHSIEIKKEDFKDVVFKRLEKNDYYQSIMKTIYLMEEFFNNKIEVSNTIKEWIYDIAKILSQQKVTYGHFELHQDNIIVNNKNVYLIDFEKFHPHIPYIDLISLLMNGNIEKNKFMEYIEYYKCKAKILDEKSFCEVLDLVNLYYNLKIINMIIRNSLGYETIWEEENGEKIKKIRKTESKFGIVWNKQYYAV